MYLSYLYISAIHLSYVTSLFISLSYLYIFTIYLKYLYFFPIYVSKYLYINYVLILELKSDNGFKSIRISQSGILLKQLKLSYINNIQKTNNLYSSQYQNTNNIIPNNENNSNSTNNNNNNNNEDIDCSICHTPQVAL